MEAKKNTPEGVTIWGAKYGVASIKRFNKTALVESVLHLWAQIKTATAQLAAVGVELAEKQAELTAIKRELINHQAEITRLRGGSARGDELKSFWGSYDAYVSPTRPRATLGEMSAIVDAWKDILPKFASGEFESAKPIVFRGQTLNITLWRQADTLRMYFGGPPNGAERWAFWLGFLVMNRVHWQTSPAWQELPNGRRYVSHINVSVQYADDLVIQEDSSEFVKKLKATR